MLKVLKVVDTDINLLACWKKNESTLPKLCLVARSILAIPASQNKGERSFNGAEQCSHRALYYSACNILLFLRYMQYFRYSVQYPAFSKNKIK